MADLRAATRVQELITTLTERGYRMTHQRLAVIEILARSEGHPSAEEIYQRLRPSQPMLSRATVYKTIDALKSVGQLLELEFRDGANRYDGAMVQPHPHVLCLSCGKLEDFAVPALDDLARAAAATTGFIVERHRLDFYGRCPACQAAAAE